MREVPPASPKNTPTSACLAICFFVQIARQKKARKAREQLFNHDGGDEEEEEEEEEEGGGAGGSGKRSSSGGKGGAGSDSDDEEKDAGVWADNEAEAMMGPGDEAKVSRSFVRRGGGLDM